MPLLSQTPTERKALADQCFDNLKANNRHSCAGCDLDHYCRMAGATTRWFFTEFLPAIDPAGHLGPIPYQERES